MFSVVRAAAIARQRRGKHVSAAMNQHSTVEELSEMVLSTRPVPRSFQWDKFRA
jgi:DNA-binding MurR/RpiR family transcriptional regulator